MIGLNFSLQELLQKFEEVFPDLIVEEWIRGLETTSVDH